MREKNKCCSRAELPSRLPLARNRPDGLKVGEERDGHCESEAPEVRQRVAHGASRGKASSMVLLAPPGAEDHPVLAV